MRRPIREALACANRSTCSAELTLTICGLAPISEGSLVFSVRSMRTRGWPSTHAYSSGEPNRNDAVIGTDGSSAPACSRASTPSLNISVQTRKAASVGEPQQRGVGHGADPGLDRGAVGDAVRDQLTDALRGGVDRDRGRRRQRLVGLDRVVDDLQSVRPRRHT